MLTTLNLTLKQNIYNKYTIDIVIASLGLNEWVRKKRMFFFNFEYEITNVSKYRYISILDIIENNKHFFFSTRQIAFHWLMHKLNFKSGYNIKR